MLTYSIMLSPYDDIAQMYQHKLVRKDWTPNMDDARELLCLICDKHAHRQQANKNNSNISRSRHANHGGGNPGSHNEGKPCAKSKDGNKDKQNQSHCKAWTESIKSNTKYAKGKEL